MDKRDQSKALEELQNAKPVKDKDRRELRRTIHDLMAMGQRMNKKNCLLEHELAMCQEKLAGMKALEDEVKELRTKSQDDDKTKELRMQLFNKIGRSEMLEDELYLIFYMQKEKIGKLEEEIQSLRYANKKLSGLSEFCDDTTMSKED